MNDDFSMEWPHIITLHSLWAENLAFIFAGRRLILIAGWSAYYYLEIFLCVFYLQRYTPGTTIQMSTQAFNKQSFLYVTGFIEGEKRFFLILKTKGKIAF